MSISTLPAAPSRSDAPDVFIAKADALMAALAQFVTEANATAAAMNLNSTTDTSATSNSIGTGAKTFTVSSGKSFQPGMYLVIADTAAPSTNSMFCQVTSYSGTSLAVNCISFLGSGTKTAWTISQSAAGGASRADVQGQTVTAFTSAGTAPTYTVTTSPAYGAYNPNQRMRVKFHAANSGAASTLNMDGLGAKSIKQYDSTGAKVTPTITLNQLADIEYDGTDYVILDPLPSSPNKIEPITAAVNASALTVTLNPTSLDFRSSTLASGSVNTRSVPTAITLTVSNGSTLGTVNGGASRLAVLAIDNAGTVELAICNAMGSSILDESTLISTTAEGGAGAADSANVIYSTTARSSVPFRIVGYIDITEATAGTWASSPTVIQGAGVNTLNKLSQIQQGVSVTPGAVTSVDFTGIPLGVKRIVIGYWGLSYNTAANPMIQVGAGSIVNTGYASAGGDYVPTANHVSNTTGFVQAGSTNSVGVAANAMHGIAVLTNVGGNTWIFSSLLSSTGTANTASGSGSITLTGTLDRLRITTQAGTSTIDAGSLNISWE